MDFTHCALVTLQTVRSSTPGNYYNPETSGNDAESSHALEWSNHVCSGVLEAACSTAYGSWVMVFFPYSPVPESSNYGMVTALRMVIAESIRAVYFLFSWNNRRS